MKIKIFKICIVLFYCLTAGKISAQNTIKQLKVGDQIPDIKLPMVNYSSPAVRISDFRGKIIILDFWTTTCVPCIESLPMLNLLEKKYSDKVIILPVTYEDEVPVKRLLAKINVANNTTIKSIVNDRTLVKLFPHDAVPYKVYIDGNGIIKSLGEEVTEKRVGDLIQYQNNSSNSTAKPLAMAESTTLAKDTAEDQHLMSLLLKKGMSDFAESVGKDSNIVSCHLLTKYIPLFGGGAGARPGGNWLYTQNMNITAMFQIAYGNGDIFKFGPGLEYVELQTSDTASFWSPKGADKGQGYQDWRSQNGHNWNYFVKVPDSASKSMRIEEMKRDLAINFPYVKATIIKKKLSCLILRPHADSKAFQIPKSKVSMDYLRFMIQWGQQHVKLIDETGYHGYVNIEMPPRQEFQSPELITERLNRIGLDLVKEEREIEILVIRDLKHPPIKSKI